MGDETKVPVGTDYETQLQGKIEEFKAMSVEDIESIGKDTQRNISEQMSSLLDGVRCVDIGKAGEEMVNLSVVTSRVTTKLNRAANNSLSRKILGTQRWLKKFDSLERVVNGVSGAVDAEAERLNSVLQGLTASVEVMRGSLSDLEKDANKLQTLYSFLQGNSNEDSDGMKLQACMSRMKVTATLQTLTSQEIAKAVLIIKENKEVSYQLEEVRDNLIPMFKTMMVNVIAAKANEEALALRKNLIKVADRMVIVTAQSISTTADDLIECRKEALISPETLSEARDIIYATVNKVVESSKIKAKSNLDVISSLNSSRMYLDELTAIEEGGEVNG